MIAECIPLNLLSLFASIRLVLLPNLSHFRLLLQTQILSFCFLYSEEKCCLQSHNDRIGWKMPALTSKNSFILKMSYNSIHIFCRLLFPVVDSAYSDISCLLVATKQHGCSAYAQPYACV